MTSIQQGKGVLVRAICMVTEIDLIFLVGLEGLYKPLPFGDESALVFLQDFVHILTPWLCPRILVMLH
jgi:hypothetical protein